MLYSFILNYLHNYFTHEIWKSNDSILEVCSQLYLYQFYEAIYLIELCYIYFNRLALHEGWRTITFFGFFEKGSGAYGYNKCSNADDFFWHVSYVYHVR